ncbi:zf-HC2 domain-containing protein (plasmid) [Deinococcus sp. KNUC1210]|uniref:zf-HC2 domain-containing protein n=1 Tax=Deinococcus sp. KNUC1210 TaxID=2917691 RepID=UPI001EF0640D|nr:zf-HC2 domain-containing protein [Deinococcus sp. KNUC1210]ULH17217.1 zf-HC2 domain-containing protein [Deinococcus sp. KNUC1210]
MNAGPHPNREPLERYALGLLAPNDAQRIEDHLRSCLPCRRALVEQQDALIAAVEALPAPGPLPPLRLRVQTPVRPRPPQPLAAWPLVASLALLVAALGLGWGWQQSSARQRLEAQQQLVSGWLARADVRALTLTDLKRRPSGRVLIDVAEQQSGTTAGQGVFVLPDPPAGLEYRAWVARNWKLGDPMTLVSRSRSGIFKVALGVNDYLCLSLDRSDAPRTRPQHILGKAFY